MVHGALLYFIFSGIDWLFFFDRTYLKHPKFLKNQVFREILTATGSIPVLASNTECCYLLGYLSIYMYTTCVCVCVCVCECVCVCVCVCNIY